jgi:hypothetical protein
MTDAENKALSTHVDTPEAKELIAMTKAGLLPAEIQQTLIVATSNLADMREVATPVGERHFNTIDTTLSVRHSTPVSKARECLTQLGEAYDLVRTDYHKFRKIFLEVNLAKAKIKKMELELEGQKGVDVEILEAEILLEHAKIEELESEVSYGERQLKTTIAKATTHAENYEAILKDSGKESFTKDEFEAEEFKYYARSAWYHASIVFNMNIIVTSPGATPIPKLDMGDEVVLYFEGLGITRAEIEKELGALSAQRLNFDLAHGGTHAQSFEDHFNGWLDRTVEKYLKRIEAAARSGGIERVQRISKLIDPNETTEVEGMGDRHKRRSMFR